MAQFFTRQCLVDPQAMAGTYSTIGAALAGALAGGVDAASNNFWEVLVAPGVYNESFTVYDGVTLRGSGAYTVVRGTMDVEPATEVSGIFVDNSSTSASAYAVRLLYNGTGGNAYLHNCVFYKGGAVNGPIAAIEVSGSATN